MTRIGILSDTHGRLDDRILTYFADVDEIWHAGDIGSADVLYRLQGVARTRAVFGNIDGYDLRLKLSKRLRFTCEGVDVLLTHIAGYPGHYDASVRAELMSHPPRLLVCGHSHILRVMHDARLQMLCVNPGAAGTYGQQTVQTLIRMAVDGPDIKDLEVIELARKTL
ncbi:MAG: metallophosphoesterase family protein [Paludibacteraceae bacterium]|nr:metallophosphoesterase family protein [Paludibacteraceae bacterium]